MPPITDLISDLGVIAADAQDEAERLRTTLKKERGEWAAERDDLLARLNAMAEHGNVLIGTLAGENIELTYGRAAKLLRDEIKRLDYPKSMYPQQAEKIAKRQEAFTLAARYLEGDTV